ncbi:MAG: dihydrofolate reductase family protein [Solirubrobacteraceae bacterium]
MLCLDRRPFRLERRLLPTRPPSRPPIPTQTTISSAPIITFRRLLPSGDPVTAEEIVTGLGLHERSGGVPLAGTGSGGRERPYVVLNMAATLDGRATLQGRSGPISGPADRALFHGLRSVVDAVMAGAGTMRTERYGPIVPDPGRRRLRCERGLDERPLACVVSASLAGLTPELPLLADADSRVIVLTASPQSLPVLPARVEYVRARREDGSLDLAAALVELHDRLHVRTLLCEGGPHLNLGLLSAGLVNELFLSISPLLAGGGPLAGAPVDAGSVGSTSVGGDLVAHDDQPLRILAGIDFTPPLTLELCSVLEHDSHLFLRYRVRDGG